MHTVLAGGVGAARYLRGALEALEPSGVTAVVNVADDIVLHGLHVSPDLDTCTYTLAGAINPERGWGLVDESWQAMTQLGRYGGENWFNLGDRDLGTHLYRTQRLAEGATLTEVTAEIVGAWELDCRLLPVSDDRIETRVTLAGGEEIGFQEYFVRLAHDVPIEGVRFGGIDTARPTAAALEAIESATTVVIAPSNPVVSIAPVVGVPGVREALVRRRESNVAISPIVGGRALKGPADRMMRELGDDSTVVAVAGRYRDLAATLVIDGADAHLASEVEAQGIRAVVMPTVMSEPGVAADLARACHEAGRG